MRSMTQKFYKNNKLITFMNKLRRKLHACPHIWLCIQYIDKIGIMHWCKHIFSETFSQLAIAYEKKNDKKPFIEFCGKHMAKKLLKNKDIESCYMPICIADLYVSLFF